MEKGQSGSPGAVASNGHYVSCSCGGTVVQMTAVVAYVYYLFACFAALPRIISCYFFHVESVNSSIYLYEATYHHGTNFYRKSKLCIQ